jgi:hypothetical protein
MFNIVVEDPNDPTGQGKTYVWQNSWGLSTRTIGVMVMVHGDNQGLVLPPRVASIQVVVVPCGISAKTSDEERKKINDSCDELAKKLNQEGIRAKADLRDGYTPGYKFNDWEQKVRTKFYIEKKETLTYACLFSFFLSSFPGCPPPSGDWPQGLGEEPNAWRAPRHGREEPAAVGRYRQRGPHDARHDPA